MQVYRKFPRYEKILKCSWARCSGHLATAEDHIEHMRRVHLKDDPFTCKKCLEDCTTVYEAKYGVRIYVMNFLMQ